MKQKYRKQITRFKKKICNQYNHDECIVGKINNDDYIQMLPCVELLHKKKNGSICTSYLEFNTNMKTFNKCPKCGEEFIIK